MQIKDEHRPLLEKTIKRLDSSFFYYDLDRLKAHLEKLSSIMDEDILLWYACKANPLSSILKVFRNLGFGVDVASKGELDHVLASGLGAQRILSTGPSKSRKYMGQLLDAEVNTVVCESLGQVAWLNKLAAQKRVRPQVLLRLQLEWQQGQSVLGGDAITPFGEDFETWQTLELTHYPHLDFIGMHAFQWGNILDPAQLKEIWWKTTQECQRLAHLIGLDLKVLDLGGGLGIPYSAEQSEISFETVNATLKELKNHFRLNKVWMELGRYAVGPYGCYMTQVIDRKRVRTQEILVLDGGINHIARPALTKQPFPCELFRKSGAKKTAFQVHGPLCTALDELGTFELPLDTEAGDWLCFHQCGAYGFTEAMPFFLCHNLPAEVIMYQGDLMIPRSPKTSADWLV